MTIDTDHVIFIPIVYVCNPVSSCGYVFVWMCMPSFICSNSIKMNEYLDHIQNDKSFTSYRDCDDYLYSVGFNMNWLRVTIYRISLNTFGKDALKWFGLMLSLVSQFLPFVIFKNYLILYLMKGNCNDFKDL